MRLKENLEPGHLPPEKSKENEKFDKEFKVEEPNDLKLESNNIKMQDASDLEKVRGSLDLSKEAIRKIEDPTLMVSPETRVSILLCAEGMKPVTEVYIGTKDVDNFKNVVKNLGLNFFVSDKVGDTYDVVTRKSYKTRTFILAKESGALEECLNDNKKLETNPIGTLNDEQKKKVNDKAGNKYGYPKTAVDAFINKEPRMEMEDYPEEIKNSELGKLLNRLPLFIKSKAHWQEEVEVYSLWMEKIKELSPAIYQMILKMRPTSPEGSEPEKNESMSAKLKNIFSKFF